MMAIRAKEASMVEILLENNADINHQNFTNKKTPLMIAVECESEYIVNLLLKYNADHTLQNMNGKTAFFLNKENL